MVQITERGEELQERAVQVPKKMEKCVNLEPDEAKELYRLLYKLLGGIEED